MRRQGTGDTPFGVWEPVPLALGERFELQISKDRDTDREMPNFMATSAIVQLVR